jgi:2-polyprenyl-3-methyl-5-hydroxy-6-metoxy-1,4-benzoquinol methylase
MDNEMIDEMDGLEDTHWWYQGNREICFHVLDRTLKRKHGLNILDIGCGTGYNLTYLKKYGAVEGIDLNEHAVNICRKKGFQCSAGSMTDMDLPAGRFDLVTFFDVLNQVSTQRMPDVLGKVRKGLKTGGYLMLKEPALRIAGGRHDLYVGIRERFDKKNMRSMLSEAGFDIVYMTYLNTILFLPIVVKRKKDILLNRTPSSDLARHSRLESALFLWTLRLEKGLIGHTSLPFGVSLLAVAKKR